MKPWKSAFALSLFSVFGTPSFAQGGGEVLWRTDIGSWPVMGQPRVAPDGTIYVVTNQLHAIAPDGQVLWTAPASRSFVDLGPDGTIYTASYNTIFAYAPDGTELWRFDENPAGLGIHAGPTVGPDGNLYAVFLFGMSIVSLTPQGQLRWSVPSVSNNDGPDLGRIVFGPNKLYFSEERVPGCSPWEGLTAVSLSGQVEWCRTISGVVQPPAGPEATLDGRAIVWQNALPGNSLQVFRPDGTISWTRSIYPGSLGVGPDANIYVWLGTTLSSLTPDGATRWNRSQPIASWAWKPVVAPDARAVVSGAIYGFDINGRIVAADPADGDTLWMIPVTGASAGGGAPAAFSNDSEIVYVPVNTISMNVPDQLWAIRVHDSPFTSSCAGSASACPCGNAGAAGRGCENSSATGGARLVATGTTQPDTVVLEATGLKPSAFSIVMQGTTSSSSGVAFGDGLRCAGGTVLRLFTRQASAGVVRVPVGSDPSITARSAQLGDPISQGITRHYQVFYRDPFPAFCPPPAGGTFNMSNVVSVIW